MSMAVWHVEYCLDDAAVAHLIFQIPGLELRTYSVKPGIPGALPLDTPRPRPLAHD